MIDSTLEVLAPRVVAMKPPDEPAHQISTIVTHYAALQAEVLEPMLQELAALEQSLEGAGRLAASAYRAQVAQLAASMAARAAAAR